MVAENKCVSGYHLGYLLNNPTVAEELKADMKAIFDLYRDGKIKVKVDSTYGFSKIGEAMKRMHSRLNIGKIILKPDSEMPAEVVAATTTDEVKLQTSPAEQPVSKAKVERNESKKSKKGAKAEPEIKKPIVDEITASPTEKTKSAVTAEALVADLASSPSVEPEKIEQENLEDGTTLTSYKTLA